MSALCGRLMLVLTGGFLLINTLFVTLARTQPLTHPILTTFSARCEALPSPCWLGISPGHSTFDHARATLLEAGYQQGTVNESLRFVYFYLARNNTNAATQPGCVKVGFSSDGTMSSYLRLYCMDDLRLGMVFALLGLPQGVLYRQSAAVGDTEFLALGDDAQQLSGVLLLIGSGWNALSSPVSSIDLYPLDSHMMTRLPLHPWYGFISTRQYCRLQPYYPRC